MPLQLDVVTIERSVYSASDVDRVVVPGSEGIMVILPRHEPLISSLKEGVLEIVRGDQREILAIGGGFIEVRSPQVVVMADVAEQADEIDVARAEAARARAEQAVKEAPSRVDAEEALSALRRAGVRLEVAKRRRHRGGAGGGVPGGE